jgi:radical SAM protein with 4Fe4S-binding SPASM domain
MAEKNAGNDRQLCNTPQLLMYYEQQGTTLRSNEVRRLAKGEAEDIQYYLSEYEQAHRFPLFTQVLVETRTDCNFKCSFCPQSERRRSLEEMSWEIYRKILSDLATLQFSGRIALYMTNEPLLDARLVDFVREARRTSPAFFLDVTTNGSLLTVELLSDLLRAGIDNVNINDYRADRTQFPNKLSPAVAKIEAAFKLNPKIHISRRRTDEVLTNRAGNVTKKEGGSEASFCNYPFRKLAIAPTGDVVLCCFDYQYDVKIGNVLEKSLDELWHSEALNQYRFSLLSKKRTGLCAGCDLSLY